MHGRGWGRGGGRGGFGGGRGGGPGHFNSGRGGGGMDHFNGGMDNFSGGDQFPGGMDQFQDDFGGEGMLPGQMDARMMNNMGMPPMMGPMMGGNRGNDGPGPMGRGGPPPDGPGPMVRAGPPPPDPPPPMMGGRGGPPAPGGPPPMMGGRGGPPHPGGPPPMMGGRGGPPPDGPMMGSRGGPPPPMGEMGMPDMMGGGMGPPPGGAMFGGHGGPGGPRPHMGMGYDPSMGPMGQGPMGPMGSNMSLPPPPRQQLPLPPPRARFGGSMPGAGPGSNTKQLSNDYCQHFVDTGQRPANFLRDSHLQDRYEEYPKMKELNTLKEELVSQTATSPYFLKADLKQLKLSVATFGTKFDVILVDPPWEEYVRRAPGMLRDPETWSWQEIMALEIENIADTPSFIFLWCGDAEGLDAGRHCLKKWGFRRSEDICWIKTNQESAERKYLSYVHQEPSTILTHTKEHCLLGIRGNVRRANDGHVIHTNVDTDVLVSEEPALGSTEKPEEMYHIIERFCQGRRRLELFGEDRNIRPGWVTVGRSLASSNFNPAVYSSHFKYPDGSPYIENRNGNKLFPNAPCLLPMTDEIEALRPRSPPR